jgi:hypothetical protein
MVWWFTWMGCWQLILPHICIHYSNLMPISIFFFKLWNLWFTFKKYGNMNMVRRWLLSPQVIFLYVQMNRINLFLCKNLTLQMKNLAVTYGLHHSIDSNFKFCCSTCFSWTDHPLDSSLHAALFQIIRTASGGSIFWGEWPSAYSDHEQGCHMQLFVRLKRELNEIAGTLEMLLYYTIVLGGV